MALGGGQKKDVQESGSVIVDRRLKAKALKPDNEMLDSLTQVDPDDLPRLLQCSKLDVAEILQKYSQDISCSGCVRTLKVALSLSLGKDSIMNTLFQERGVDNLVLRPRFTKLGKIGIAKVFGSFNAVNFLRRGNHGKRQRCSLHTANPRVEQDWLEHWNSLSTEQQEKLACMDVVDLSDALSEHLKDLYFCRDCRGNVLRALDMLVGYIDYDDLPLGEEFCEELFAPFWLTSDEHWDEDDNDSESAYTASKGNSQGEKSLKNGLEEPRMLDVDVEYPADLSVYSIDHDKATIIEAESLFPFRDSGELGDPMLVKDRYLLAKKLFMEDLQVKGGHSHSRSRVLDDPQSLEENSGHSHGHGHGHSHGHSLSYSHTHSHGHSHSHSHTSSASPNGSQSKERLEDNFSVEKVHRHSGSCCDAASFVTESESELSYCPEATHVACALHEVPPLIIRAQDIDREDELVRQSGQASDRHAPTLRDGQAELLHCIGKLLLERIKTHWHLQLVRIQTDELYAWLVLACMRTNIQTELQGDKGNEAMRLLLEEEDRMREANFMKNGKKKNKKKQQKNKKKAATAAAAGAKTTSPTKVAAANLPAADQAASAKAPPVKPSATQEKSSLTPTEGSPSRQAADLEASWDQDAEARLMAQLCEQLPEAPPGFAPLGSTLDLPGSSGDSEALEEGALTDEELREAQLKLKALMAKGSRAELRASLREKFNNLCHNSGA